MIIRFPSPKKVDRLESHPSSLNRTNERRLSRREIEHRQRMLEHLRRIRPEAAQ
jgi:hypothetical protein